MNGDKKKTENKDAVLFSWIGFKDLSHIGSLIKNDSFNEHLDNARKTRPTVTKSSTYSPILQSIQCLKKANFNIAKIILFFDLKDNVLSSHVQDVIGQDYDVSIIDIGMDTEEVHKYSDLFEKLSQEWPAIAKKLHGGIPCFNLSSGTTAMNAMLIIFGKTKYPDAKFIQINADGNADKPFTFDFNINRYALNNVFESLDLTAFDPVKGESAVIQRAKKLAAKAAQTDFNVLIFGESGTGKELFAKGIHDSSSRKNGEFRAINCAAIPSTLLESTLFGYKKGSFTGANKDTPGLFEACDKGTLFLDEIEACSPELQAKLLRVLQPNRGKPVTHREFSPVGAEKDISSDVRIIAAANMNLESISFRSDLLNRLAVLTITLPPLRERGDDVISLAKIFLKELKKQLPRIYKDKYLGDSAIKFIESCPWRGNVRQLQNALTQAVVFGENNEISAEDFGKLADDNGRTEPADEKRSAADPDADIPSDIQSFLKDRELQLKALYMRRAFEKANGNKSRAAEMMGISYQTWDNWRKTLKKEGFQNDF